MFWKDDHQIWMILIKICSGTPWVPPRCGHWWHHQFIMRNFRIKRSFFRYLFRSSLAQRASELFTGCVANAVEFHGNVWVYGWRMLNIDAIAKSNELIHSPQWFSTAENWAGYLQFSCLWNCVKQWSQWLHTLLRIKAALMRVNLIGLIRQRPIRKVLLEKPNSEWQMHV